MGSVLSTMVIDDEIRATNATFIVPSRMSFTVNQMAMMMESGQQPGIPFCLGDGGVQRPQGNKAKVNFADNSITLDRSSLRLVDEGQGLYSVSFIYDATVMAKAIILVGVKDKTTCDKIVIDQAVLRWGPYILEPGIKRTWSSKTYNNFVQDKQLPGRCRSTPIPDIFDIVISLAPIINSTNIPTPDFAYNNSNNNTTLEFKNNTDSNSSTHANKMIELTTLSNKKVKNTVVIPIKDGNTNSNTNNNNSPVSLLSDWTNLGGWTQSFNMSSLSIDSVDPTGVKINISNPNNVMREVSYVRIASAGQTMASAAGQSIPLKCIMQRVQMINGVYLTQDLYGMDTFTEDDDNTEKPKEVEETNECCICLTDPREVAVYPCRHMCMCRGCASALPSQGNKCPICRRAVALLLIINKNSNKQQKTILQ